MSINEKTPQRDLASALLKRLKPLARELDEAGQLTSLQKRGPGLFSYCCIERERLLRISADMPRIGIVLDGEKEFWLGDKGERFMAGDVFALPANVPFDVVNIPSPTSGRYESLLVEIAEIPSALRSVAALNRPSGGLDMRITLTPELVDALAHAAILLNSSSHASVLAEHRLCEVLMLLANERAAACLFARPLTDRVAWLVAASPEASWTAERLGKALGMGASTLRRHLKRQGTSLRNVLAGARMQLAYRMLADGSGIGDAALAAGYVSRSHFARRFKQVYGREPAKAREEERRVA